MPAGSRPGFLERPRAIVGLVGGLVGIVAALVGIFGVPGGEEDGTKDDTKERIAACVREHDLPRASEKRRVGEGRWVFRRCAWPAPPGAAGDGFSEITVASRPGPGASEAEGLTVADVFTTTCRDVDATYLFDNMGALESQSLRVSKGEIRRVEGGSVWSPRGTDEEAIFTPRRDESVVLSSGRYELDAARCVG